MCACTARQIHASAAAGLAGEVVVGFEYNGAHGGKCLSDVGPPCREPRKRAEHMFQAPHAHVCGHAPWNMQNDHAVRCWHTAHSHLPSHRGTFTFAVARRRARWVQLCKHFKRGCKALSHDGWWRCQLADLLRKHRKYMYAVSDGHQMDYLGPVRTVFESKAKSTNPVNMKRMKQVCKYLRLDQNAYKILVASQSTWLDLSILTTVSATRGC